MHGDLQKMITDDSSLFDVLGDFFYHQEGAVRAAALEVYIRRAFTSYEVTGLTNLRLETNKAAVKFDFLLPQSHPNRSYNRMRTTSTSGNGLLSAGGPASTMVFSEDYQRHGVMTAFTSFEEFTEHFEEVVELFYDSPPESPYDADMVGNRFSFHHIGSPNSFDDRRHAEAMRAEGAGKEPSNIVNVALRIPNSMSDDNLSELFADFCRERVDMLKEKQVKNRMALSSLNDFLCMTACRRFRASLEYILGKVFL